MTILTIDLSAEGGEVVDWSGALTQMDGPAQGSGDVQFGSPGCVNQIAAQREIAGQ